MSNPFSPDFAGSTSVTSTSEVSTTATTTFQNSSTMAPSSSNDVMAQSHLNGWSTSADPYSSSTSASSFAAAQTSVQQNSANSNAYGGASWTSPIEIKKRQQAEAAAAKQKALMEQQQAFMAQQQATTPIMATPNTNTGLAGLTSPPPLPSKTDDSSVGGPMGGSSGSGYSSDTSSLAGVIQEEDEEYLKALRAAYDAKALMEKQAEEQKKKQGAFGLGNLIPKQPNFFRKDHSTDSNNTDNNNNNNKPKAWFQQTASPTRDTSTPPWHSTQDTRHAATSDFGIPPPAQQDTTVASNNQNYSEPPNKGASVMGASVVGGVAGLMLMGPLVGVVGAGAAAYAAGTKEGPVGSILRGTGSLAATGMGAAKRFDDRHKIVSKTTNGVATGVGWVVKTVNKAS